MAPGAQYEMMVVVTGSAGAERLREAEVMTAADPEGLAFCCFFRSLEGRAAVLERLRAAAAAPAAEETPLAGAYADAIRAGAWSEALAVAVAWWTGVRRGTYHVYSLRAGYGPYRTSCLIAFRELGPAVVKQNYDVAVEMLKFEQARVVGSFGIE